MKFCDKLAQLRKASNLSQEQLADKLDVSRQSVSKWESGDTYPDMAKLIQLCNVLNCKLPDLMDDGTFDENYRPKDKEKNSFSSYMNNFLDYVTKTYNMFIHMTIKAKLTCLAEMLLIGVAISIITVIAPDILEILLDRVFRYVPYGYTVTNVLVDICTVAIVVLGVIVFFHLFKIRYLDYYVTVTDNTINEQIVEEPIKENLNVSAIDNSKKKEKVVIRDPKHSISHFLDGIAKIFIFIFKIIVIMCSIPALLLAVGAAYLTTIMFVNCMYSGVFTFAGVCLTGCAIIGFIFVYMAINFIFKRKQPVKTLIILFLSSLLMISVGAGLATDKALNMKVVDDDYNTKYNRKEFVFENKDIKDGYQFEFNCYNIEREIDDSVEGVKVILEIPEDVIYTTDEYTWGVDGDYKKGTYFNFGYVNGMAHELYKIKNDIKNGYIRENYGGPHERVKVKVVMSSETDEKIGIIYW